jgi:hypothetical protein
MRLALVTVLLLAATVGLALAGSRPAPGTGGEIQFAGTFRGPPTGGSSKLFQMRVDPGGTLIWQVDGDLPARCRGSRIIDAKAIFFATRVKQWPIRADGKFGVAQRYDDGGGTVTLRVTGEFRGDRVRGIARAKERGFGGLVCTGKRRFTARRTEG